MLSKPIRMTILGGFLGSGKTTILNNIIRNLPEGQRTAILIYDFDDFGDINLDALLIDKGNYSRKEIKGACKCGSLKEKLLKNLLTIVNNEKPDHIYIEASGLVVPWELKKEINNYFTADKLLVVEVIVCTDALQFNRFHDYLPTYSRQFEGRPLVLMTKADIHDSKTLNQITVKLRRHYPGISGFSNSINGVWSRPVTLVQKEEILSTGMKSFLLETKMIDTGNHGIEKLSLQGTMTGTLESLISVIKENKDNIIRLKALIPLEKTWHNIQFDGESLSDTIRNWDNSELDNTGLDNKTVLTLYCMKEHKSYLKIIFTHIFENL